MKKNTALNFLIPLLILIAGISASVGLFSTGGSGPFMFTSLHSKEVQMYGYGIYQFDTHFRAPIARGTDAVTLFAAIPLLIVAFVFYRKESIRGAFFLTGILSYFLYNSASMALGIAYNPLFLVYIIYFSCSFFAFILAFFTVDYRKLPERILPYFPHKVAAIFLFFAGLSVFVWLSEILTPLLNGVYPDKLDTYTTEITFVLDLGIIPPACYITGLMVLRKAPKGYMLASVLITLCSMIGLVVISQSIFQYLAGIVLEPGQYIGFVGTFVILGIAAIRIIWLMLRNISQEELTQQ